MPIVKNLKPKLKRHLKRQHLGKTNAVPSRALEKRYGVCGSTIRRAVLELRKGGAPICSGNTGYYYAQDTGEVWGTIDRMERRLAGSHAIVRCLRCAAGRMPDSGQTRIESKEARI